jgi:hypothetical protein
MLIIENPTVTVKCGTEKKCCTFILIYVCWLSVRLDSLSCSFSFISFLTNLFKSHTSTVLAIQVNSTSLIQILRSLCQHGFDNPDVSHCHSVV